MVFNNCLTGLADCIIFFFPTFKSIIITTFNFINTHVDDPICRRIFGIISIFIIYIHIGCKRTHCPDYNNLNNNNCLCLFFVLFFFLELITKSLLLHKMLVRHTEIFSPTFFSYPIPVQHWYYHDVAQQQILDHPTNKIA